MAGAARLAADAVVIGTGAGGGPVAATLAEAGIDTLVLDAGPRLGGDEFTGEEGAMMARLYRLDLAPGSGMALYAGECVGGSTVINDALCFRPPADVLAEWSDARGLGALAPASLAPFVERAWLDVHAEPTDRAHTSRNAARLQAGAERLGWSGAATPRNVIGCANLGLCNLGCPSGAKQSTLLTYVPRAERAGARVLGDTRAERVVVEQGRVRGVEIARLDPVTRAVRERARIETRLVCVAAGVLGTPALLQRSGLRAGDGVQVHSSLHVTARFAEAIHGYYGPTMAYAVDELSDVGGHDGPGVMIESVSAHPVATAGALPGFGAAHEALMRRLAHYARALVVIRDRTRGRIDAHGSVAYTLERADVERLRAGLAAAARAYLAAGAIEVHLPVSGSAPLRTDADCARFAATPLDTTAMTSLYAVHLFGGAVMAARADAGTCDERGACFGVRGLHVADASGLPSNTGVNPQITIMANALRVAAGLVEEARRA
jgi:choline dehydrogenase-like flavoprotein